MSEKIGQLNEARQGCRSGHHARNLTTTSDDVQCYAPYAVDQGRVLRDRHY